MAPGSFKFREPSFYDPLSLGDPGAMWKPSKVLDPINLSVPILHLEIHLISHRISTRKDLKTQKKTLGRKLEVHIHMSYIKYQTIYFKIYMIIYDICHVTSCMYFNMGVKRSVRTSEMQPTVIIWLHNCFYKILNKKCLEKNV